MLVATPTDQLQAVLQNEQAIIRNALQPLVNRGVVEWEFCDPPTPMELLQRLKKNPHVLHFVGHGAFDYDGDDPSPAPILCLEKPDRTSAKVDADTLDMMLRNSGVRLVVLSACSTAAPTPKQVGDTVGPFDGVAQRLVAGFSTVSAAVAMQFDLEAEAAEVFNETLYNRLLMPDAPLDAVVAECRGAMMSAKKLGHRCWVNPVLYWRCKEGKLFSFQSGQAPLNDQTRAELLANEMLLTTWLAQIAKMWAMPPAMRQAFTTFFADYLQNVEQTLQTRCQLLGEAVRLRGGPTSPGQPVACPLILHLPAAAQIGDVQVGLSFPANKVALQGVGPGGQTPGSIPLTGTAAPGVCTLLVQNASHGAQWPAGDHELAVVNFVTQPGVTDDRLDLSVSQAQIHKDGAVANFGTVNAFLFVG